MNRIYLAFFIAAILPTFGLGQGNSNFNGNWTVIPQLSHDIGLYGNLSIEFHQSGAEAVIVQKWGTGRAFTDSLDLKVGGSLNNVSVHNRVWPANVFMGVSMPVGGTRQFTAMWEKGGRTLQLVESYSIRGSEGMSPISTLHTYVLSEDNEILTYTVARSSRTTGPAVKYVLKKAGTKDAYFMRLEDNWEIQGKLPTQAFLISLQGLANGTRLASISFILPVGISHTRNLFTTFSGTNGISRSRNFRRRRQLCKPSRNM